MDSNTSQKEDQSVIGPNLGPVEKEILESSPYMLTPSELAKTVGVTQASLSRVFSAYKLPSITGRSHGIPPQLVRKYMVGKGHKYEPQIIAHINMRGGIGKTTSTISSATRAAQYGYNVVVIDLDSQGSASQSFNLEPDENDNLFIDIWNKPKSEIRSSLKKVQDNLWVLPSSLENGLLDNILNRPDKQKEAVSKVCKIILDKEFNLIDGGVDLIFIDCPPSLGAAIISTICAADIIVIPVQSDAFSFRGLQLVLQEIGSINKTFGLEDPEIKILYTAYDARKKLSVEVMQKLVQQYGQYLVPTFIRSSTDFDKAISCNQTIFSSPRASQAKEDYDMYVKFLLDFGENTKH